MVYLPSFPPPHHPLPLDGLNLRHSTGSSYFSIFYRYCEWPLAGRSWVRNPVTERFSAPFQTGCESHPVSSTTGVESFTGLKWPGRDIDVPPSSHSFRSLSDGRSKASSKAIPHLELRLMKTSIYTCTPPSVISWLLIS